MAKSKVNAIPAGDHEVTVRGIQGGRSRTNGEVQIVLTVEDANGNVARRYAGIGLSEAATTARELAVLGWTGNPRKGAAVQVLLKTKPVLGRKAMARVEEYGTEGKTLVTALWGMDEDGPEVAEAEAIAEAFSEALPEEDEDDHEAEAART